LACSFLLGVDIAQSIRKQPIVARRCCRFACVSAPGAIQSVVVAMIADDINKRCGDTVNISDSPNDHVHFHVYFVDGLFEEVTGDHWTSLKRVFVVVCKGCELDLRMH
jgi:hypothetical protein